ncbi:MAG: hypothetical protein JO068_14685 [Hyphomicrobiales bacterium]|nr:hypothetical protein [Hyphomicrobiales bacterium]
MGEAGLSGIARRLAFALVPLIAGCTVGAAGFTTDFREVHEASIRASTTEAVVGPDGRCESDISIDPSVFRQQSTEGIPLGSTECEVVARLGGPYSVEIKKGPHGERVTRLTYVSGPRFGAYDFISNRLTRIEH